MAELRQLRQANPGNIARAKEKQASAQLRGKSKGRSNVDDQSNVNKLYRWVKKGIKSVESGFPAQTKGGTYTHQKPRG
jgi:hypothetical protein